MKLIYLKPLTDNNLCPHNFNHLLSNCEIERGIVVLFAIDFITLPLKCAATIVAMYNFVRDFYNDNLKSGGKVFE